MTKETNEPNDDAPSVIDCHTHLPWHECVPAEFLDSAIANMLALLRARGARATRKAVTEQVMSGMQDRQGDALVEEMALANITQAAVLVPDLTFALRSSNLTIEELLLHHRNVGERHGDKLVLFAGVDPRWGADGIALFERAVEWGFRGLKLYPPCGFNPSDPMLYPYYEVCRKHSLPVLVHIGPTAPALSFSTSHPLMLDQACRDFGSVNFVLGHGGSHYVEDCVMMAAFRPNVYLEFSGFQRAGALKDALRRLSGLFEQGLNHKILFGTDFPVFQTRLADLTAGLWAPDGPFADLADKDAAMIARENFRRLWTPAITWNNEGG